jgi:radical SAM-linked protein
MQSESEDAARAAPALPALATRSRYRVRFQKAGDLRLVSHHDLMHCLERMLRRAALPVATTHGFNPRPRLAFAQSLALGVVGRNEVLELELTELLSANDVHRRLVAQCPPGLAIHAVKSIDPRASARVRRARFRIPLLEPSADLPARCAAFLAQEHCWIERTRPQQRRLDIRPFVAALEPHSDALEMTLWITPHGAARPEEVAAALGLEAVLEAGAVLERTDLELADETADDTPLPAGLPLRPMTEEPLPHERQQRPHKPAAAARSAQPTALIPGPLSFDS